MKSVPTQRNAMSTKSLFTTSQNIVYLSQFFLTPHLTNLSIRLILVLSAYSKLHVHFAFLNFYLTISTGKHLQTS
jgi:hypothetical protein